MSAEYRVLLVEDSENDAFFIIRELQKGGLAVVSERVDTMADVQTAALRAVERWPDSEPFVLQPVRGERAAEQDALELGQRGWHERALKRQPLSLHVRA